MRFILYFHAYLCYILHNQESSEKMNAKETKKINIFKYFICNLLK